MLRKKDIESILLKEETFLCICILQLCKTNFSIKLFKISLRFIWKMIHNIL